MGALLAFLGYLLGSVGLFSFLLGSLGLVYLGVTWIIRLWRPDAYPPLHERPLLTYSLAALLLGAQLLSIGFLAELLIAHQSHSGVAGVSDPGYSIAERTGDPP